MNAKQFLLIGGIILLVLGIFGFLFPNPLGNRSILHFDAWENAVHTVLGIGAIAFAYVLPKLWQRWLALIVGVVALFFAIAGFAVSGAPFPNFLGAANLENPIDNVIHLAVGIWGIAVFFIAGTAVKEDEKPMRRIA